MSQMGNLGEEFVTISDTSKLLVYISGLYLNEKFSDIVLIVGDEKIHAHKVILAARSTYLDSLISQGNQLDHLELELAVESSPETFRNLLKFLYTGTIKVDVNNIVSISDLISLARQYSFIDLELALVKKLKSKLNLTNVCPILNTANLYDLTELRDACYSFMDEHSTEIITGDCFNDLSQNSLIKLLERDSFFAPEIDIFNSVMRWCQDHNDVDDLVRKSVRLSWLSVVEILSVVWPSKLVSCEELLQVIAEVVEVRPRIVSCRGKLLKGVNIATREHKVKVISGLKTVSLLNGNRNVNVYAECSIGDKDGFTIEFGFPVFINHIQMMLWDKDIRFYHYYVEASIDKKKWKMLVDHRQYACRSVQNLYFEKEVVKFVRIIGTHNTKEEGFHLVFFEAFFMEDLPKIVSGIVCPTTNVATIDKKAAVIEGANGVALLDGILTDYKNYTHHIIDSGSIVVELAQPYILSSLKLLLWDEDTRTYKYYVSTSINKFDWTIVADYRNEERKSWQVIRFTERPVVFIRITGTANTAKNGFHLMHFECPASDDLKMSQ